MNKPALIGSFVLSLAFAGGALAQGAQAPISDSAKPGQTPASQVQFSSIDQNKDGRLSQTEVRANAELNLAFATLDADRDSYLSQSEFGKWKSSAPAEAAPPASAPRSETAQPQAQEQAPAAQPAQ